MSKKRPFVPSGFTFVELLIVLAVLTVLAAVLFSVVSRVREKARSTTCQSNQKQIALAIQQYVQNSDGRFPPTRYELNSGTSAETIVHWFDIIEPYIKSPAVFQCPSSSLRTSKFQYPEIQYFYNWVYLNDLTNLPGARFQYAGSHETKPILDSTVFLTCDFIDEDDMSTQYALWIQTPCGEIGVPVLHSGGANYSFVDGHVKWLSATKQGEVQCALRKMKCLNSPSGCP